ncbi:MAG: hypothetical protein HYW22_02530 [Candidatus Aenigmarchaeota archaeon]|nr:hypothetical protein [Candidatus Aenigmarchaeota archaeon]
MKLYINVAFIMCVLGFSGAVIAAPLLHDPNPVNNTFIIGGNKLFSINATSSNLNSSAVALHIISQDAFQKGEDWDKNILTCINTSGEWNCTKSLSFAIAGSDTIEYFYFRANDTDGSSATSGTMTNPYLLTIDRQTPTLSFIKPVNDTYVKGTQKISFNVVDSASGVDNNTVQYSFDNSTWTTMKNISVLTFEDSFNTLNYADNQTVTLYGKASDIVGNNVSGNINFTVDNELSKMTILSPSTLLYAGYIQLKVNVTDSYSGVDLSNVAYSVESLSGPLSCTIGDKYNATCSALFDTSQLSNGNHTILFSVTDKAGNLKNDSVVIQTDNSKPTITISSPDQNSYLRGNVTVTALLTNANTTVQYVLINLQKTGVILNQNMTCDANITRCQYTIDTTSLSDGAYALKVTAVTLSNNVVYPISVTLDNKAPAINILSPSTLGVSGTFTIQYSASDEIAIDKDSASFKIGTLSQSISCSLELPGRNMICSTDFNSKTIADGTYTLQVFGNDLAGNTGSASTSIKINNGQSGGGLSGGSTGTSSGSGTSSGGGSTGTSSGSGTSSGGDNPIGNQGESSSNSKGPVDWLLSINLPFGDNMLLYVVIGFVAIVVIILAIIVKRGLRKTIIAG